MVHTKITMACKLQCNLQKDTKPADVAIVLFVTVMLPAWHTFDKEAEIRTVCMPSKGLLLRQKHR